MISTTILLGPRSFSLRRKLKLSRREPDAWATTMKAPMISRSSKPSNILNGHASLSGISYRFEDVYCSRECSTARREDIAERKRIEEEAKQAALVKWPGIEIIRSGCGCSPREGEGSRYLGYVAFKFPGQKYGAISWNVGDTTVWCPEGDKSAFEGYI